MHPPVAATAWALPLTLIAPVMDVRSLRPALTKIKNYS